MQAQNFTIIKGFHSMVLLAVCAANYCFTMIDVGDSGRHSDGGVFSLSEIGKQIQDGTLFLPSPCNLPGTTIAVPYCFVGDNAFPLLENLLRPFPDWGLDEQMHNFNYRLSRARRCIGKQFVLHLLGSLL